MGRCRTSIILTFSLKVFEQGKTCPERSEAMRQYNVKNENVSVLFFDHWMRSFLFFGHWMHSSLIYTIVNVKFICLK